MDTVIGGYKIMAAWLATRTQKRLRHVQAASLLLVGGQGFLFCWIDTTAYGPGWVGLAFEPCRVGIVIVLAHQSGIELGIEH